MSPLPTTMHPHWVAVCMPDLLSLERRDDHRMLVETGGKPGKG